MVQTQEEVHWNVTAGAAVETELLRSSVNVDVAIVGGGLTGCRTALGLAEEGTSVALLDSKAIGWGASGRSGGQCNPIWRETPRQLADRYGGAQAERLVATTLSAADDLFNDIRAFDIDCDPVQAGWLQAAHCRSARRKLERLGAAWSDAGARIDMLEGAGVASASGSGEYEFALLHRSGGHVQPLSLTRGFARAAQKRGARIFRDSPVTRMERQGRKWVIATPEGSVTSDTVVLTTNAYSNGLWPGLQRTFYPMVSIALATAPLSPELQTSVLPGQVTISDTRLAIYFARYDRDGRLIFGCIGSADKVGTLGGKRRLQEGLHTVFPQLRDIGIERTWAGRIAVTPEMIPHLHAPEPGVLAALGFSGRGIAMTSVMGRSLVSKVLGRNDEDLPFPVTPIKPIPLHGVVKTFIPFAAPAMTCKDKFDKLRDRGK
ncbi:FAD-binding oxidoreductase [Pelagibius litoralis]|uniref:FAD-binding oxidoreductase n=1 Tax=Pelagibius litoralis TaxID=374515 RepID=A0A967F1F6_9PROT|nr:FAD-binding oxidoreductase [Pelagibius litoralis]NIA71315.1 FAD-binding oxidoreductase [Pelagibius litoralis]